MLDLTETVRLRSQILFGTDGETSVNWKQEQATVKSTSIENVEEMHPFGQHWLHQFEEIFYKAGRLRVEPNHGSHRASTPKDKKQ